MSNWIYVLVGLFLISGCTPAPKEQPNVILIITDDQGYGDIAAHGNPYIKTPHIDQLYQESVRFTDFHVSPTCSPTRAALMTGRYTNRTGAWHTIAGWSLLRQEEKTLGNLFTQGGYNTGAFGKWHLGDNYPFRALDRGFQRTVVHGGGGVQQTPDLWENDYFDDRYLADGQATAYQGYCTDVFFEEAMAFIEEQKEQPFFCYISTNAPHGPFNVPPNYLQLYEDIPDSLLAPYQKRFYGMISNIDDNLGKLRAFLTAQEIADNTILIFMSDNGTAAGYRSRDGQVTGFNSGMRGTKNSAYEGGHRVPFYVYWKDGQIQGGKDISTLAAHIDVMPTLAEWCNVELPTGHLPIDGRSLAPLFEGDDFSLKSRVLVTDSQRRQVPKRWLKTAVLFQNWRLVNGEELYDIKSDPGQVTNLLKEQPKIVDTLREVYDQWWERMAPTFSKEPAIIIGNEAENPSLLSCHDWHTEDINVAWNQIHIRQGEKGGLAPFYWTLEVAEPGAYQVQFFRYPPASNLKISDNIAGLSQAEEPGLAFDIPEGKGWEVMGSWIQIDDAPKKKIAIDANDQFAEHQVQLAKGPLKLSGGFILQEDRTEIGAYYALVTKLD